jgi:hypothetical protein
LAVIICAPACLRQRFNFERSSLAFKGMLAAQMIKFETTILEKFDQLVASYAATSAGLAFIGIWTA